MRQVFLIFALTMFVAGIPLKAHEDGCPHPEATVQSLHDCVEHAAFEGHIENAGVAESLLAKLGAAQAALNRGQEAVAVHMLEAFIHQVQALSGVQIDAIYASHMVEHAEAVIESLLT
jgi:hypothetical protein